jgi:sugar phosphate isomerase/epimerase
VSSYYRHDANGVLTGCGSSSGPIAFRPSLQPGETEVEISDELAAEIQANGLEAYTHAELSTRPTPVPESISPLQARKALRQAGLLPVVTSALDAADEETREAWEYATEIRRENALVAAIAAGVGMTAEQIDDLFRLAGTL